MNFHSTADCLILGLARAFPDHCQFLFVLKNHVLDDLSISIIIFFVNDADSVAFALLSRLDTYRHSISTHNRITKYVNNGKSTGNMATYLIFDYLCVNQNH